MGTDCTSKCERLGRAQEGTGWGLIDEGAVVCASELQRVIKWMVSH